ncbi:MAG: HD domain-containing protein [Planctomycetes bacterium]|nr:HD domain-containing protein [Planctomycetota bacterium]
MVRQRSAVVVVRDPVHGDIELTREELRVVDTAAFQRLRGIKQLGTAYLVYPGAMHTRFEHALGTVHVMDRLLDASNKNAERDPAGCHRVSDDERRILRIAALLHDVTHIPFGHNLEDQTGLLERHDEPWRFEAMLGDGGCFDGELGAVLRELGIQRELLAVLAGRGLEVPPFWRQVLSDTIDADLLDYLRRDAYFTGLELRYDQRVREYFRIDRRSQRWFVDCEKQGMLREDIASELLRLLEIRYHFSERVYYHHAKIAAGALVARMVELALRAGALTPAELQTATDESLLFRLEALGNSSLGGLEPDQRARLRRFMAAFRRRRLLKRVIVLPAYLNAGVQDLLLETWFRRGAPEARYEWEAEVEREAKRVLGRDLDVVMYCPARRMQLKEARTLVRFPGTEGAIEPLETYVDSVPRLRDLRDSYPRLWKLYVFTSEPELEARRRLQQICLERLPAGVVNALRL